MNKTSALKGSTNDRVANLPPKQKTSEAEPTSLTNDKHAEAHELNEQEGRITPESRVDSGTSNFDGGADDYCDFDEEREHEASIIQQVISEGGTIDEAFKALDNLFWYGSRHEPHEPDDDEPEVLAHLLAVRGL